MLPPETLAAFDNDSLRARIFYEKYALRNSDNEPVEFCPEQMWTRLTRELASVERPEKRDLWERNFVWLLTDFRFVPGGRILHAIGNPNKVTALNCYVIPAPHDSIAGIYRTARVGGDLQTRGRMRRGYLHPSSEGLPSTQRRQGLDGGGFFHGTLLPHYRDHRSARTARGANDYDFGFTSRCP